VQELQRLIESDQWRNTKESIPNTAKPNRNKEGTYTAKEQVVAVEEARVLGKLGSLLQYDH
jgi:hypothetical protein